MKCRNLQIDLALFADDILSADEQRPVEAHLASCPLCRQTLFEIQSLRNDLRSLTRPEIPINLLQSVRFAVDASFAQNKATPAFVQLVSTRGWLETWLMPSMVAGFATLAVGFALLSAMLTSTARPDVAAVPASTRVLSLSEFDRETALTPTEYARSRMGFGGESPSINPEGALIALTKSLVRGEMHDDEVTVVADVFGNGLAQIAEVVEPSHNVRAVGELQKALESDPAFAPFVPAQLDHRTDSVRVVFKLQSVNVPIGNSTAGR